MNYIENIHEIHDDFRDVVTLLIFLSNLEKLLVASHYLIWIVLFCFLLSKELEIVMKLHKEEDYMI